MLLQQGTTHILIIIIILLGFLGAFLDSSLGMGYGLLTPLLLLLGFSPLIVVPVLLISQMAVGLSGTLFHSFYENIDLSTRKTEDVKVSLLSTGMGLISMTFAFFFIVNVNEFILTLYISLLMVLAGILMFPQIKFGFSWKRMVLVSGWASFNKVVSGGGYGPVMTIGQITSGREARESVAVTDLSEALLAGYGFFLYFICHQYCQFDFIAIIELSLIMIISGICATPFGPLITKKLEKKYAKRIIGSASIIIGIFTLIRLLCV